MWAKNWCESFWQLAQRHKYSTYEKPFIFQISIQKSFAKGLRSWAEPEASVQVLLMEKYICLCSDSSYASIWLSSTFTFPLSSERKTACFSKFWQSVAAHAEKLISRLFYSANCVEKGQPSLTAPVSCPSLQEALFRFFCLASVTRAPKRKAFALTSWGLSSQNAV